MQEVTSPNTAIALRTPVPPLTVPEKGFRLAYSHLGYQAHYAQLAQATRHVADIHGLHLVDVYSKLVLMNEQKTSLRDGVHASSWVGMDVINTYLNIIARKPYSALG